MRPGPLPRRSGIETAADRCGRVRRVNAQHTVHTRNWWWTAHPAAH
ncbi:trp operon leader peptide [Streptomyces sp. URMC 129]